MKKLLTLALVLASILALSAQDTSLTQAEKDENAILKYLKDNKIKKKKIKKTESGIYHFSKKKGKKKAKYPKPNGKVTVHYQGTLLNGTQFDSSYERNEPATFPLKGVIKGWQQGIPLYNQGSEFTLLIPSHLAYGKRATADIPANSVLRFDVELIEVLKSQEEIDEDLITAYLANNKLIDKAQRTESGLYYIIDEAGTGDALNAKSTVTVHYKGTLLNGTQFDSSYERGEPNTFPLNRVIKGWTEGIPLFKTGGKGTLIIPSHLAYGQRAMGKNIPANSVLRFDIEVLKATNTNTKRKVKVPIPNKEQMAKDEAIIAQYIAENDLGKKAKRTESGLYYIMEKQGNGPSIDDKSTITVHYKGTLLDGTQFDSSYERGQAATFPLAGVIKGWQEGLPKFYAGGKGTLIIPSHLAYGNRAMNDIIKANSILRFDFEILEKK